MFLFTVCVHSHELAAHRGGQKKIQKKRNTNNEFMYFKTDLIMEKNCFCTHTAWKEQVVNKWHFIEVLDSLNQNAWHTNNVVQ